MKLNSLLSRKLQKRPFTFICGYKETLYIPRYLPGLVCHEQREGNTKEHESTERQTFWDFCSVLSPIFACLAFEFNVAWLTDRSK